MTSVINITYGSLKNGRHFVDDISICIFMKGDFNSTITEVCTQGSKRYFVSIGSGSDLGASSDKSLLELLFA